MANTLIKSADIPKDPALMAIAALLLIAPHLTKADTKRLMTGETPLKLATKAAHRLGWITVANALQGRRTRRSG